MSPPNLTPCSQKLDSVSKIVDGVEETGLTWGQLRFSASKRDLRIFSKEIMPPTDTHHPSLFLNCSNPVPHEVNIRTDYITAGGWLGELWLFKPGCDFRFSRKNTGLKARRLGLEPGL